MPPLLQSFISLIRLSPTFVWAISGAAPYINTAVSHGTSQLLSNKIRAFPNQGQHWSYALDPGGKLTKQRWEIIAPNWHNKDNPLEPLTRRLKIGSDSPWPSFVDLSSVITQMRSNLTVPEVRPFRKLGKLSAR